MSKFEVNEIVVVLDRGRYYESKILKVECYSQVWKYFVHFQGWKRRWDCWMDESLIFKHDDEGKEMLKLSKLKAKRESNVTTSRSDRNITILNSNEKRTLDISLEERRRKKRLLQTDMIDDTDMSFSVMNLQIPLTLKKHMVDEWKIVTNPPFRVLSLPRPRTVSMLLEDFLASKKPKVGEEVLQKHRELLHGLKAYFDKALPLILLYRQERTQYQDFLEKCSSSGRKMIPSDVYGLEHLLRLFVRLPSLSSQATIVPSDTNFVHAKLVEFLKFVQKNSTSILSIMDYVDAKENDS